MSLPVAVDLLKRGDWQAAHTLVQHDESPLGCWAHGIVHRLEGDDSNARYWYARAKRADPAADIAVEIAALDAAVRRAR